MGNLSAHFAPAEFACRCGCGYGSDPRDISPILVSLLEEMRVDVGRSIHLTSGCRCAVHNAREGGVPNSAHTRGCAADLLVQGGFERHQLVGAAMAHGAMGVGVAKVFIHVDVDDILPRPAVWGY